MTTSRERLEAAMNGQTPDRTPLAIYDWFLGSPADLSAEVQALVARGLGLISHAATVQAVERGVETTTEEKRDGPDVYHITRKKTPLGELRYVLHNGWHHESWIKEPKDYKIWQWIVEHTELKPSYDAYYQADRIVGDKGIVIVSLGRTPAMRINVDIAGTERFCMDVALEVPELFELYEAMVRLHRRSIEIAAAGPGRFAKWLENLTISMLGPKRYSELLVPIYRQQVPVLEAGHKRTMVHYDGQLGCIRREIASAPFHVIESLTEPPEGDMLYDECRAAWPNKAFWGNLNVDLFYGPTDRLRQAVIDKRNRAGKRALAFEISEDMPKTWQETIPVVLDTLQELD